MTHICVSKITIIGSDNGLLPGWCQAIIWFSVGISLIGPLGTNCSENLIENYTFSLNKIDLKMSPGKWQPFCLALNVLITEKDIITVTSNDHHGVSNYQSIECIGSTVSSDWQQRNIKSPHYCPFVRGIHWIPHTKGQQHGKCFYLMMS